MIEQGLIKAERSKIIWQSAPLPNDAFAVSEALARTRRWSRKLQAALDDIGGLLKTQPNLLPAHYTGFVAQRQQLLQADPRRRPGHRQVAAASERGCAA